jgi:hypothetical protein
MLRQVLLPACALAACAVQAQVYPHRPMRMVVPFACGWHGPHHRPAAGAKDERNLGQNLVLAHHDISQGNDPVGSAPAAFAKLIREELDPWRKLGVAASVNVN